MKRIVTACLGVAALAGPLAAQSTLEFEGRTWTVTAPDAVVEEHLGRTALKLRNGGVFLPDADFRDGTIEYDVATTGHRSFVGAAFRLQRGERTTYEEFYLRPHQTGRFDATQYTPNHGGLTAWQLYPEYNAPVEIPRERWIHVRLEISGTRMEAFVGDVDEPTMVVEDLRMGARSGGVGLYGNFPEAGVLDLHPTAFSRFRMTPAAEVAPSAPPEPADPSGGLITEWAVSEAIAGDGAHVLDLEGADLDALAWEVVPTDARGRINVAERRAFPDGARQGRVFARVVLHAEAPRTVRLGFGFSDYGSVFLDGRLLFTGNNTYRSRSMRYLGVMTVDNDALSIPLRAGDNTLVVAVTEAFGGWGLVARLEEAKGVTVRAGTTSSGGTP